MIKIDYYLVSTCSESVLNRRSGDSGYTTKFYLYDGCELLTLASGDSAIFNINGTDYPCTVSGNIISCDFVPGSEILSDDWYIVLTRDAVTYKACGTNRLSILPIPIEYDDD